MSTGGADERYDTKESRVRPEGTMMGCEIRQLTTLYRLARLLARGTQGSSLLRRSLKEALGLTGGCGGQVLLLKSDHRTLVVDIEEGEGLVDGREFPADAPPWADVIREGKIVRLQSTRADI